MEPHKISISYLRLIAAVEQIYECGYLVSDEGLYKVLSGSRDEETKPLRSLPSYGSYLSLSSKKLKGRVHTLVRHHYLALSYSEITGSYLLVSTHQIPDLKKRDNLFPHKEKKEEKPTIIACDKGEKR